MRPAQAVRIRATVGHVLGSLNAYRILVAEDDDDFRAALAALLEADGRFAVAGRASTGCEAVELARKLELDATLIRGVLLPAAMKLLGEWNWYLPRWLEWLPRLNVEADLHDDEQKAPAGAVPALD